MGGAVSASGGALATSCTIAHDHGEPIVHSMLDGTVRIGECEISDPQEIARLAEVLGLFADKRRILLALSEQRKGGVQS